MYHVSLENTLSQIKKDQQRGEKKTQKHIIEPVVGLENSSNWGKLSVYSQSKTFVKLNCITMLEADYIL